MRNHLLFLLGLCAIEITEGCGRTTTTQATTTTSPLCCPPLSRNNPPRVPAPTGSTGDLDECAVLRRIQRGMCPPNAQIVCSPARGSTVDRVVLQFINGTTTVILVVTDTSRAVGVIHCTASGYQVLVNNVLSPFTSVSCTQNTLEGPNFVDYYNDENWNSNHHHKHNSDWKEGDSGWQGGSNRRWKEGSKSNGEWQGGSSRKWRGGTRNGEEQQGNTRTWIDSGEQWNDWKQ